MAIAFDHINKCSYKGWKQVLTNWIRAQLHICLHSQRVCFLVALGSTIESVDKLVFLCIKAYRMTRKSFKELLGTEWRGNHFKNSCRFHIDHKNVGYLKETLLNETHISFYRYKAMLQRNGSQLLFLIALCSVLYSRTQCLPYASMR